MSRASCAPRVSSGSKLHCNTVRSNWKRDSRQPLRSGLLTSRLWTDDDGSPVPKVLLSAGRVPAAPLGAEFAVGLEQLRSALSRARHECFQQTSAAGPPLRNVVARWFDDPHPFLRGGSKRLGPDPCKARPYDVLRVLS